MTAKHLKGTRNLNPTDMVMKQGSKEEREPKGAKRTGGPRMPEAHEVPADNAGVENSIHNLSHPAMQTRHSHPKNVPHHDGRKHEDDHHAVRKLKGMM